MNFYILSLFPDMVIQGLHTSILGRAVSQGNISIQGVNIRDYTNDKHGKADDYPYGGGAGMLMQAQPIYDAYQAVMDKCNGRTRTIYVTPQGIPFTQKAAEELSGEENLIFLCGHYEGIDERVLEEIVTDYISIGDYVLTGGELPAMVMIDAISRLVPGVLHNDSSKESESFHNDLLEYPQYTRPEIWKNKQVPEVLLSGNHKNISKWRHEKAKERTAVRRPDLYNKYKKKEDLINLLLHKKRNYIHMIETLRRGHGEILYAQNNNILLYDHKSRTCQISIENSEFADNLLGLMPDDAGQAVVSQEFLINLIAERCEIQIQSCCYQACYTRQEMLPVKYKDIHILDESHLSYICSHYAVEHVGLSADYMKERLRTGNMCGAFFHGQLAGFAGIHDDGSMGMLYVEEGYRGQGLGEALEAYIINRIKESGFTPYCHFFADNLRSRLLQEKLGLCISSETIWWLTLNSCFPQT